MAELGHDALRKKVARCCCAYRGRRPPRDLPWCFRTAEEHAGRSCPRREARSGSERKRRSDAAGRDADLPLRYLRQRRVLGGMQELLNRPAAEYGFYFLLAPAGFFLGNFVSGRVGRRVSNEAMVLTGSVLSFLTVTVQSTLLIYGLTYPLTLFIPGFFITFAQGTALPYAQSGAMATIPQLAGTAAGIGVFLQHFFGAAAAQLYGVLADGTPRPMLSIMLISSVLSLLVGTLPTVFVSRNARR
jgi:hypothetical protein